MLALTLPSQPEHPGKKENSRRRNISLRLTKERAQHTILLDSVPPDLAILRFQTLIYGSIVQQDSRQGWVDNWNG